MEIHFNSRTGDHKFLSNFYAALVEFEGVRYPTVEHAYQAAKTPDPELRTTVCAAPSAVDAKRLGARLTLREDWDAVRLGVMKTLLRQKFRDPDLRARLLATGDAVLVHKAPWDAYWGDGKDGKGQNVQGRLLMALRDHLRA